jgi:uncharacterized repeat protein (TIGR01451 family)
LKRLISSSVMFGTLLLSLASGSALASVLGFAPDAPIIGSAIAGDASASVSFTPPAFDGGSPVLDYQARCGGAPVIGSGSPIIVAPLVNGVAVTCTVTARNQFDSSAPSAPSNSVTPRAPTSLQLLTNGTPSAAGTPVTFTAQITPNTARGSVSFTANSTPIGGCVAVVGATGAALCTTTFNSIGTRVISASYGGNTGHFASAGTLLGGQEVIAPNITITPALNDGATAVAYGPVQLQASGGAAAYAFTVTAGSLPNGLTLSGAGLLAGVPTLRGAYNFTVTATDTNGFSGTRAYSITLRSVPAAPTIGVLSAGNASVSITFTPPADDGGSPITLYNALCSVAASGPASPILLNGLPNGVPLRCRVNAVNAIGTGPVSELSNEVTPQATTTLQLQTSASPAIAGAAVTFTATLAPTSATGSIAFAADAVPISGCTAAIINTGTAACITTFFTIGTRAITAAYTGDAAHTASVGTLAGGQQVIAPTITITPDLLGGTVGAAYGPVQLVANGGLPPHNFAVIAGSLPMGLALSSSGVLAGTPTAQGLVNFTVSASDSNAFSGARVYNLAIVTVPNVPVIVTATPLNSAARIAFNVPTSNGGSAILDYTASCTPGAQTATGNGSPIDVNGLNNQWAYRCSLRARNAVGSSPLSAALSVVPGSSGTGADLSISKSNGSAFVNGGVPVDYLIVVNNPGPAAVIGARIQDALAPDFSAASWSCTPLNNAACPNPASGTGALDALLDLPANSSVQINFSALPIAGPETPISNIASVTPPAGITDPSLNNNVATDGPDLRGIFRNAFE